MTNTQDFDVVPSPMLDLVLPTVEKDPDRELVYDRTRRLTYGQALDEGVAVGMFLRGCGVRMNDTIAVILPNWCEFLAVRFAICACRAAIVPLVGNAQPDTVSVLLEDLDPAVIVVGTYEQAQMLRRLGYDGPILTVRVSETGDGITHYEDVTAGCVGIAGKYDMHRPLPEVEGAPHIEREHPYPDLTSCIIYTSGSTGRPKGVAHDFRAHIFVAKQQAHALRVTENDVFYVPMSFGHIFGMGAGLLMPLISGGRMVFIDRYRPEDSCALIEQERCTVYFGVPTMYIRDLDANEDDEYDLTSLRTGIIAGDLVPPTLIKEYEIKYGCRLLGSYGMTETAAAVTIADYEDPEEIRITAGRVLDGVEMQIVDRDGNEVEPGVVGQIVCRTPGIMSCYVKDPKRTAEQFDPSGRFLTGDLGYVTPDGALHVTGRLKDMIIRGGMNIFPSEVEAIYLEHPGVSISRLVGYPDRELGQRTCLFVEPEAGCELSRKEVRDFAFGKIEKCKVPDMVVILDAMPRLSNGKIDNVALKERLSTEELKH